MVTKQLIIDNIPRGLALEVLRIIGIDETFTAPVTIELNTPSESLGRKDKITIESELDDRFFARLSLIASTITVEEIDEEGQSRKLERIDIPNTITGMVRCDNPRCLTNEMPVMQKFTVEKDQLVPRLRCQYCESIIEQLIFEDMI
ncbi:MAG: aspartate carbamoyltransferase regulatory subunit [Candidatus Hodarchaeota archaeon]